MVPVQSCHIAECKKMAEKNKKLIKKLEAKQKKALQRKFLSPEYLMVFIPTKLAKRLKPGIQDVKGI